MLARTRLRVFDHPLDQRVDGSRKETAGPKVLGGGTRRCWTRVLFEAPIPGIRWGASSRRQYFEGLDESHQSYIPIKSLHCNLQNLCRHILIEQLAKMPTQGLQGDVSPGTVGLEVNPVLETSIIGKYVANSSLYASWQR